MPYRRVPLQPFKFRYPQARTPIVPRPTYTPAMEQLRPRPITPNQRGLVTGTYPGTTPNDRDRRQWLERERLRRLSQMRRGY